MPVVGSHTTPEVRVLEPMSGSRPGKIPLASDAAGNVYVGGTTDSADFPTEKCTAAAPAPPRPQLEIAEQFKTLGKHKNVEIVAFAPDGKTLASLGADELMFWEVATGEKTNALGKFFVNGVAFAPDGKTLALAVGLPAVSFTEIGSWVELVEVPTGKEIRMLSGHRVSSVAFAPDGKTLASGSGDKTVKLWEVATGKEIRTLSGHTGSVWSVAFAPDGKTLASGSDDETVKLWEVATGKEIRTLRGHTDRVWSVAFAPDGKTLALASDDGTVKLWDLGKGSAPSQLAGAPPGQPAGVPLAGKPEATQEQGDAALAKRGCDAGKASECARLGLMYAAGEGVAKDLARAALLFKKACDGGDTASCSLLPPDLPEFGVIRGLLIQDKKTKKPYTTGCVNLIGFRFDIFKLIKGRTSADIVKLATGHLGETGSRFHESGVDSLNGRFVAILPPGKYLIAVDPCSSIWDHFNFLTTQMGKERISLVIDLRAGQEIDLGEISVR